MNQKKELLRGLWVGSRRLTGFLDRRCWYRCRVTFGFMLVVATSYRASAALDVELWIRLPCSSSVSDLSIKLVVV